MSKRIEVKELIKVLETLPDDVNAEVNRAGNLKVTDRNGLYVGFVDFADGVYHRVKMQE